MCPLCFISIQTETQISLSLCSSYAWIHNLVLTKKKVNVQVILSHSSHS